MVTEPIRYVSLLGASDGAFVVIYDLRKTPMAPAVPISSSVSAAPIAAVNGVTDTVFAMRVSIVE